ncbi:MAG: hypothetical protein BGP14_19380 [Sphingobacteriales bacterium 44-15]|nr:MAG: hypothetical protein BGP14_19380 [Sphingobacteriales bacterium 44-15]
MQAFLIFLNDDLMIKLFYDILRFLKIRSYKRREFLETARSFFAATRSQSASNKKKALNHPAVSCLLLSNHFPILGACL